MLAPLAVRVVVSFLQITVRLAKVVRVGVGLTVTFTMAWLVQLSGLVTTTV